jgi:hypothetical protein
VFFLSKARPVLLHFTLLTSCCRCSSVAEGAYTQDTAHIRTIPLPAASLPSHTVCLLDKTVTLPVSAAGPCCQVGQRLRGRHQLLLCVLHRDGQVAGLLDHHLQRAAADSSSSSSSSSRQQQQQQQCTVESAGRCMGKTEGTAAPSIGRRDQNAANHSQVVSCLQLRVLLYPSCMRVLQPLTSYDVPLLFSQAAATVMTGTVVCWFDTVKWCQVGRVQSCSHPPSCPRKPAPPAASH